MTAPMIPYDAAEAIKAKALLDTKLIYLALESLNGIRAELTDARFPGINRGELLADPENCRQIELLAGVRDVQEFSLYEQTRHAMLDSLAFQNRALQSAECTPAQARDIGENLIKIAGYTERQRSEEGRSRAPRAGRRLAAILGVVQVHTLTGASNFKLGALQGGAVVGVLRAMRCTTDAEIAAVLDAIQKAHAGELRGIALEGF